VSIAIDFHNIPVELFLRKIEMAEKDFLVPFASKNIIAPQGARSAHSVEHAIARTKAG
jgi:hypothetical protein